MFRSDVLQAEDCSPGDIVEVVSPAKQFLALAFFNPHSQITLRVISHRREEVNRDFWKKRIERALAQRELWRGDRDAYRVIFGESDQLPGLILDRYRHALVFQTLSLGMDLQKPLLISLFGEVLESRALIERNEAAVRELEGLPKQRGIVKGGVPTPFEVREGQHTVLVDPIEGHKTGLYLDQAENRTQVARYVHGRALDAFAFQGEFAIHIADKTSEVICVDSSVSALKAARGNFERNGIRNAFIHEANVFDYLRECQNKKELFDTIILDPPPFVRGKREAAGGLRGYKEINLRAMKILRPGGILVTCSCSQNFTESMFFEMLQEASRDAKRELQVLEKRGAAPDHPVLLSFPESAYLQCWILQVL